MQSSEEKTLTTWKVLVNRMATADNAPSEFGGFSGSIQPEPHELTSVEQARLERRMDPASPSDSVEEAREREVNGR